MSEAVKAPPGADSGAGINGLLSDERLVRRAAGGNERAFATIFDRYHQGLYRYCLAIVGDSHDAQDALQNTMVKVLRALPGEERQIQLKPWLYRIAHNESIELLRRRRDTRELGADLAAPGSGPAEESATRERLRRLVSDLGELPDRQRGALVMRELAGFGFGEIAAALQTSPQVARQTVYEARLSLRRMDEGREMSCETVMKELSDGDGRVTRRRDVRAHLRTCLSCRRFGEEIEGRQRDLAAISPLPAVAAVGLLQGLLGGHGAGGGGLAGVFGGGVAKSVGASTALKGAATIAVVAAIGVGAADRGGLIDVGGHDRGSDAAPPAAGSGAGSATPQSPKVDSAAAGSATGPATATNDPPRLGGSQVAMPTPGTAVTPGAGQPNAEPPPTSSPQQSAPSTHPHGKGHEKQLPSASQHGQQTAAEHKSANHGSAGAKGHPASPAKPSLPGHPPTPSGKGGGPSAAPDKSAAPKSQAHEDAAPPPTTGEEAPSGSANGKTP